MMLDLEDKKGTSPDRFIRSGDFFAPDLRNNLFQGGKVHEKVYYP